MTKLTESTIEEQNINLILSHYCKTNPHKKTRKPKPPGCNYR